MAKIRTTDQTDEKDKGRDEIANPIRAKTLAREGTPLQIASMLNALEKSAKISDDVMECADDALLTSLDLDAEEMDCEIDYADEDEYSTDSPEALFQTVVTDDGIWGDDKASAIDSSSKTEICIYRNADGQYECSVKKDPRFAFNTLPQGTASGILYELSSRYETLEKIGAWLAKKRQTFLKTGDLWDFVEDATAEARDNMPSVLQQNFIKIADLSPTPTKFKSMFSRFIKNVVLSWEDEGCMPLGMLFSHRAQNAWVARAYCELRRNKVNKEKWIEEIEFLRKFHSNTKDTNISTQAQRSALKSLSPFLTAQRLCSLLKVDCKEVVGQYEKKMLEDKNGQ